MAFWSGWKRDNKPRQQYYGGSEGALNSTRKELKTGTKSGSKDVNAGIRDADKASGLAQRQFAQERKKLDALDKGQSKLAAASNKNFYNSMNGYGEARGGVMAGADALDASAASAAQDYQQTAQAAFDAQQQSNANQANALAARGGAGGLRTALATSSAANAQAQQQAGITQANEMNALLGMKQNAIAQAAGIRSGVGAQDQAAAAQYSGRQAGADGMRLALRGQRAANVGAGAGISQASAFAQQQAGTTERGQYLDARANAENSQLNAGRENEKQRLDKQKDTFDRWVKPFGG